MRRVSKRVILYSMSVGHRVEKGFMRRICCTELDRLRSGM